MYRYKTTTAIATIAALALGASVPAALAFDAQQANFATSNASMPSPELADKLAVICDGETFVLSIAAMSACATNDMPRLNKEGTAFVNAGVGAEYNTLARQITEPVTVEPVALQ